MFDAALIKSENALMKKYGLKSRREVWRAEFSISKIRNLAKGLITANEKEQKEFLTRLSNQGFSVSSIADVLGLNKEDRLKRRVQSILVAKGLARTHNQARQMIAHRHVKIKGSILTSPSHLTTLEEEANVELTLALPEKKLISSEEESILKQIKKSEGEAEETEKTEAAPEATA